VCLCCVYEMAYINSSSKSLQSIMVLIWFVIAVFACLLCAAVDTDAVAPCVGGLTPAPAPVPAPDPGIRSSNSSILRTGDWSLLAAVMVRLAAEGSPPWADPGAPRLPELLLDAAGCCCELCRCKCGGTVTGMAMTTGGGGGSRAEDAPPPSP